MYAYFYNDEFYSCKVKGHHNYCDSRILRNQVIILEIWRIYQLTILTIVRVVK